MFLPLPQTLTPPSPPPPEKKNYEKLVLSKAMATDPAHAAFLRTSAPVGSPWANLLGPAASLAGGEAAAAPELRLDFGASALPAALALGRCVAAASEDLGQAVLFHAHAPHACALLLSPPPLLSPFSVQATVRRLKQASVHGPVAVAVAVAVAVWGGASR